ncbi:hypothetical protein PJ900_00275 (plasmid) [Tistrella mobilis]|uniref:Uncharacterized protein n=1 Tax=Tistrella mobilis TaxID=171437 RepID=A0A162L115_9PROT|nr:DUF6683 family protein [Tistrella mobilis]KYO52662.1 hypothetical protein AUP44_04520 [Tistrella mobilis]
MPIRLPKTTRLRLPHLRLPDLRLPDLRLLVLGALVVAMPARADQGPLKLAALTNRPSQAPVTPRALAPRLDGSLPPGRLPASDEVLSYRPDPAVRRRNFEVFVDRLRAHDAGAAENLDRLLTDNDVIAAARDWLKPYGMRPENVADAMAVYLSTAWAAVRGSDADPEPEVMRGLSDQLAAAIGATPGFTRASDAEKQELAESMIVQAVIISRHASAARDHPELQKRVGEAVARGAQATFGLDLTRLDLTVEGLR